MDTDLDLACVASFLVLVEERHYGRAAQHLQLSVSTLTKRIRRLEHQVGAVLVERGAGGVTGLTPAGVRFTREAGLLLDQARAAQAAARGEAPGLVLRLGVLGRVGDCPDRHYLRNVAWQLRQAHPDVRLRCKPVPYADMYACLLGRTIDALWGSVRDGPAAEIAPLGDFERVGVVSSRHELADATDVPADHFAGLPILYDPVIPPDWMRPFVLADVRPLADARLVPAQPSNAEELLQMVAANCGTAVITRAIAARLNLQRLHVVSLTHLQPATFYVSQAPGSKSQPLQSLLEILTVRPDAGCAPSAFP